MQLLFEFKMDSYDYGFLFKSVVLVWFEKWTSYLHVRSDVIFYACPGLCGYYHISGISKDNVALLLSLWFVFRVLKENWVWSALLLKEIILYKGLQEDCLNFCSLTSELAYIGKHIYINL